MLEKDRVVFYWSLLAKSLNYLSRIFLGITDSEGSSYFLFE